MNINEMEKKYGSVEHEGKTYILTEQASLTSRLLPDHLKDYIELSARAVDFDGEEYVVYWVFEDDGRELGMYDYTDVNRVEVL